MPNDSLMPNTNKKLHLRPLKKTGSSAESVGERSMTMSQYPAKPVILAISMFRVFRIRFFLYVDITCHSEQSEESLRRGECQPFCSCHLLLGARPSPSIVTARSAHLKFLILINACFFLRDQPLICFSREIASRTSLNCS